MSPRPRASDWMHTASDSEADEIAHGYSSEEDQRTRVLRPTKRRRLSHSDNDDDDEEDDYISEEEVQRPVKGRRKRRDSEGSDRDDDSEEDGLEDRDFDDISEEGEDEAERSLPAIVSKPLKKTVSASATPTTSKISRLSKPLPTAPLDITDPTILTNNLTATSLKKTGVLYLSRIPPYMTPSQIRHLLTPFGGINRIFLSPEPQHIYQKRIKSGGNKKRQYVEGWVEFNRKKDAKWCAESLNAQQVGGKKGGWWYDDVWNLKYLRGFKWGDLTEQIANESAARQARLRAEIAQATRENKTYIRNVERAKMVENMQAAAKEKKRKAVGDTGDSILDAEMNEKDKIRRTFKQRTAVTKSVKDGANGASRGEKSEAMKKLLSSVF
ncbi:hypothetical protein ABW19_dt0210040 [Dactylella cylindrospora]|nr:hypothetical protein ABW19_dt0210040 [Dactylella cylindrospora]